MDSDFQQQQYEHHFQDLQKQFHHQKQQINSNLTRYRSAPSSYFSTFLDTSDNSLTPSYPNTGTATSAAGGGGERNEFSNARPLSPETENIFARFMSSMNPENNNNNNNSSSNKLSGVPENQPAQFMAPVKQEEQQQQQENYSSSSQMIYHSSSKPPLANQSSSAMKIGGGGNNSNNNNINNNSSLTRHSSSPAGFFSNILDIDQGYGVMRGMENYGGGNEGNFQVNFSSGQPSSELMTQNSDVGGKPMRMNSLDDRIFSNSRNKDTNDGNYISGFNMSSWDDSILSENFSSMEDRKNFSELNASENQGGERRNRPPLLAHHLSLPKTSLELEKLLQFQDSVPCRIRAKRGMATHPRSIAERVRRTRISERMRKLQDLVPNMDKQTNTADMLDLAVDYIKELQKQVQTLNDNRNKCTCPR